MKTLTMSRAQEVAVTIRRQIFHGSGNRVSIAFCWGVPVKSFLCGEELELHLGCDDQGLTKGSIKRRSLGWLRFDVNGRLFTGMVYVVLTPSDEYNILLVERKSKMIVREGVEMLTNYCELKSETDGIQASELVRVIDELVETPTPKPEETEA